MIIVRYGGQRDGESKVYKDLDTYISNHFGYGLPYKEAHKNFAKNCRWTIRKTPRPEVGYCRLLFRNNEVIPVNEVIARAKEIIAPY